MSTSKQLIQIYLEYKALWGTSIPLDIAPMDIAAILEDYNYEQTDTDTNGWSIDLWLSFTQKDKKLPDLILSGNAMYHGYTLSVDTDRYQNNKNLSEVLDTEQAIKYCQKTYNPDEKTLSDHMF